jgi:FkbM family methyltransferase
MTFVRSIARRLPVRIPIAGKKRDRIFNALDAVFRSTTAGDTVATPFGQLLLDPSHGPERLLSYVYHNVLSYYHDSELGRYIARVAEPNATFVDIGANLGMYALVARSHGLNTVVVEPEPRHAAFLERNAHLFGKVLPVALSNEAGSLPLYYHAENHGSTSLFTCDSYTKGQAVPVKVFSELAAQGAFGDPQKVRLIKIDVEGFEAETVAGMRGFLETGVRPHIWCELRGDASGRNGGSYRSVRETLGHFGYCMRRLRRNVELQESESELAQKGVFDALFTVNL